MEHTTEKERRVQFQRERLTGPPEARVVLLLGPKALLGLTAGVWPPASRDPRRVWCRHSRREIISMVTQ